MSEAPADHPSAPGAQHGEPDPAPRMASGWGPRRRALAVAGLLTTALLGGAWLARERIANAVIDQQLRGLDLPATYRIAAIGPGRQVLRDVVIGDPRHPDLTIERIEIALAPRFGLPGIRRVTLVKPRLYGTWQGQRLSFGRLDRLWAGPRGAEPFRLPDLALAVIDGRARVLGDHGAIGLALEGAGGLRDGFAGTLAITAPRLAWQGCTAADATLFGRLTVTAERPGLAGPLRVGSLACPEQGQLRLAGATMGVTARLDPTLDGGEARLAVQAGPFASGGLGLAGLGGTIDATYRAAGLTARYDLTGRGVAHPELAAGTVALAGLVRARDGLARFESEGTLRAAELRPGAALGQRLAGFERASAATLLAPLLRQARTALLRESRGSRLAADFVLRAAPRGLNLVVPQGRLTGGSGASLLALSRLHLATGEGPARLAGNFSTGGAGLPQISGRLAEGARGQTRVTMAMADYRAGSARLAIPRLSLVQDRSGALGLTGLVVASGALPGGAARDLSVPLDGWRDAGGTLALWRSCTRVTFSALTLGDLAFDGQGLRLCPRPGAAMVASDARGTRVALGTPGLDLAGRLGGTPVRIASGPAGYGGDGALFVSALDVALGPGGSPSRFRVSDLKARVGSAIEGSFAGTDVDLAAVPLDLRNASGQWRFAGGRLTIADAAFRLEDRAQVDRFQPLVASGASLSLADNIIKSNVILDEPQSRRKVVAVAIRHDLAAGRGRADLAVDALTFDPRLQPDMLTRELLGVVANVRGRVDGAGRIDWAGDRVTSTGRFATKGLDLAAAFGPASGIAGEVEFSDLLGLVTPPHQRLTIAAINPGIEVNDGEMLFQLRPGAVAAIEGGHWPFLGGNLYLRPVALRFGVEETRRFVIDIEALDAARFLTRMELANLSATGTFDGSLPLVFDADGGRIDGGLLESRPPGGSLSYVGALTYKDLSPMANFAFAALKSLDYRTMRIAMDGALAGEVVTRVRFDGVRQGALAKRNFITRQLGRLPLQFNVNLRAPFYSLITSVKALYDPAYIRDPRSLGLLDAQGRPVPVSVAAAPAAGIQPPVSENQP